MKDYSLKINGQNYNVQIDEVNETSTVAHVTVNGTPYEVEIAGASAAAPSRPQVAPAPREANSGMITPSTAAPSPRIAPAASAGGSVVKCPLPGTARYMRKQATPSMTTLPHPIEEKKPAIPVDSANLSRLSDTKSEPAVRKLHIRLPDDD